MTAGGLTPFEIVGDDAPVCVDGVCVIPGAVEETASTEATTEDAPSERA
ncbi:hypothetical protein [Mumia sp. DW29H23]